MLALGIGLPECLSMSQPKVVHRYRYDPLDRLIESAGIQRFYNTARMATEIQGTVQHSVFQSGDVLLAQTRREGAQMDCTLLATDFQRSVLHGVSPDKVEPIAYNVYGHRPAHIGLLSVLGFNGERPDPVTGHYLLGNGYRAFNPVLMRFNSPDSWSPFGEGGINAYAYCDNEPMMRQDPTGHFFDFIRRGFKGALNLIGARKPGVAKAAKTSVIKSTPRKSKKLNPEQEKILADAVKKQVHEIIKHNIEFSKNANHGDITILQYRSMTSEGRNAMQMNNIVTDSTLTLIPLKISTSGSSYASTPNIPTRPKIQPQGKFNIADEAGNIRTWHISN